MKKKRVEAEKRTTKYPGPCLCLNRSNSVLRPKERTEVELMPVSLA